MTERDWAAEEADRRIMEKEDFEAQLKDHENQKTRTFDRCNECHEKGGPHIKCKDCVKVRE